MLNQSQPMNVLSKMVVISDCLCHRTCRCPFVEVRIESMLCSKTSRHSNSWWSGHVLASLDFTLTFSSLKTTLSYWLLAGKTSSFRCQTGNLSQCAFFQIAPGPLHVGMI